MIGRLIARLIGYTLAAGLLVAAVNSWRTATLIQTEVDAAKTAVRLRMPLDLATAGEYCAPLHETFRNSHGAPIEIHTTPPWKDQDEATQAIKGLAGTCTIVNPDGTLVETFDLADRLYARPPRGDTTTPLLLIAMQPPERGDYECRIKITTPAPSLAGRTQEALGRYEICGMEEGPVMIGRVIAVALIGAAGIASWLTRKLTRPKPPFPTPAHPVTTP